MKRRLRRNRLSNTVRYHIQLSKHRTTVSVDKIISDLLAIKLKIKPGTPQAHQLVREQLEEFIAHDPGRPGDQLSRYITDQAILYLLDKKLSEKYLDYIYEVVK